MDPLNLPDDLSELDDAQLTELVEAIKSRGAELGDVEDIDDDGLRELEGLGTALDRVEGEQTQRTSAAAERSERRQAAAARFQDEDPAVEPVATDEDPDGDDDDDEGDTVDTADAAAPVPVAASAKRQELAARRPKAAAPRETDERSFAMKATPFASPLVKEGYDFTSTLDVAKAIAEKRNRMGIVPAGVHDDYLPIASAFKGIPADDRIGPDAEHNYEVLTKAQAERQALVASGGICAIFAPSYDFFRLADPQSPMQEAMPTVQAPRGGIRHLVPPSTALAVGAIDYSATDRDYTEEGDGPKACIRVTCPDVVDEEVSAVSSCVLFDNLNYRVFPELVANFMEDVAMAFESRKEVVILDYINTKSTQVTADFEYGASRALLYDWTTAATQYRARHRMGRNAPVQIAAPFWALDAIKLDLAIQLHNSNDFWTISDQQAMAALTARRIDPVWYVDNPSGTFPNQAMATAQATGNLNLWPAAVKSFVYAPGTFVKLDGGTLDVGLVRDSVLNRTNDLQLFMEEWLGMAMLGYESIALTSFICINGTGPDAVTARTCA